MGAKTTTFEDFVSFMRALYSQQAPEILVDEAWSGRKAIVTEELESTRLLKPRNRHSHQLSRLVNLADRQTEAISQRVRSKHYDKSHGSLSQ